ncbi:hypothetical protein Tco_1167094, partial [Tanacetum coccineum]
VVCLQDALPDAYSPPPNTIRVANHLCHGGLTGRVTFLRRLYLVVRGVQEIQLEAIKVGNVIEDDG